MAFDGVGNFDLLFRFIIYYAPYRGNPDRVPLGRQDVLSPVGNTICDELGGETIRHTFRICILPFGVPIPLCFAKAVNCLHTNRTHVYHAPL